MKKSIFDRFWKKVEITDGCWEWQGRRSEKGYGEMSSGTGKTLRVHRFSWELHNGKEVAENLLVCHTCDNPSCVNPEHLFLGTSKQNVDDMISKGRKVTPNGDNHYSRRTPQKFNNRFKLNLKLTEDDVRNIRAEYSKSARNGNVLAKKYGVDQTYISKIVRNLRWANDKTS